MSIEYRLTQQDYVEAYIANAKSQPFSLAITWGLSLIMLVVAINYLAHGNLFFTVYFLFFGIILNRGWEILMRWGVPEMWKSYPSLREITSFKFNDTEMQLKAESYDLLFKWSLFTGAFETQNLFLLYLNNIYPGKGVFHLFPKRAFESEQELQRFREILQSKVVKKG